VAFDAGLALELARVGRMLLVAASAEDFFLEGIEFLAQVLMEVGEQGRREATGTESPYRAPDIPEMGDRASRSSGSRSIM